MNQTSSCFVAVFREGDDNLTKSVLRPLTITLVLIYLPLSNPSHMKFRTAFPGQVMAQFL